MLTSVTSNWDPFCFKGVVLTTQQMALNTRCNRLQWSSSSIIIPEFPLFPYIESLAICTSDPHVCTMDPGWVSFTLLVVLYTRPDFYHKPKLFEHTGE
ncbi:hypothetical protein OUZ56_028497 [Daphnia magna]|uniref:Uncharacterized protein n=1 Tax=Daphnia magna TaxID=35525 RepID=A0ABR0B451_9CRUS|nr:hypothetical protein OUZ56_028497 [Daphnia magna]